MNMLQAIKTVFSKYATFDGVAGRSEFWWWTLFTSVVSWIISLIFPVVVIESSTGAMAVGGPGSAISTIWSLGTLLPSLAVAVRRLRDIDNSWTNLFWIFLPIAGLIILIVKWCQPGHTAAAAMAGAAFGAPYADPGYPGAGYAPQNPYGQAPQAPYGQAPYGQAPQAPYGQAPGVPPEAPQGWQSPDKN